jgi:hypothetical protein
LPRKFDPHISIESKLKFGLPLFSSPTSNSLPEKFKLKPKKDDLISLSQSIEIIQNKDESKQLKLTADNQKNNFGNISLEKKSTPLDLISQRIETALIEKNSDDNRISYINAQ